MNQMQRLIWATDLHLSDVSEPNFTLFLQNLKKKQADALLLSGDIGDRDEFMLQLPKIQQFTSLPLYFILGNHDYFGSSIDKTRAKAISLSSSNPNITYLTNSSEIPLTDTVALLGFDGWADGRAGNFIQSAVDLKDYYEVDDFKNRRKEEQLTLLNYLGDETSAYIEKQLPIAFSKFRKVVFLIHPPPFKECCLYKNQVTNQDWGPHFVCKAAGESMLKVMEKFSEHELLVLTGHAHHQSSFRPLKNIHILVGKGITNGIPIIENTLLF